MIRFFLGGGEGIDLGGLSSGRAGEGASHAELVGGLPEPLPKLRELCSAGRSAWNRKSLGWPGHRTS